MRKSAVTPPAARPQGRAGASRRSEVRLGAIVVAGCIAALMVSSTNRPAPLTRAEAVLLRGSAHEARGTRLQAYRKAAGGAIEALADGNAVRAGDVVQLVYQVGDALHGAIVSHDGRGRVTLHLPPSVDASTRLARGRQHALPYAFELDDAPRFERFLLVTSRAPIDIAELLRRARALGGSRRTTLALPAGTRLGAELVLRKR